MDAQAGGRYVANETDIDSVYIYYADYSFGESINENYTRVLESNGVTVAGSQALPQGYASDWPGQFAQATSADVDAVVGGFTVATLPAMLGTFLSNDYDFRFVGSIATRYSFAAIGNTLEGSLDELSQESIKQAGLGPLITRYQWNQYDNSIAAEANDVHRENYGTNTDLFTSGTFTGASALVQAVESAGSADPTDIVDELTGMTVQDTMKGEGGYKFQEYNNQARSAMTVIELLPTEDTQYWDAPVKPSTPIETYDMDQTTLSQSNSECDLTSS
jgi:branched-chain amino acid transport system substrate-binding protein